MNSINIQGRLFIGIIALLLIGTSEFSMAAVYAETDCDACQKIVNEINLKSEQLRELKIKRIKVYREAQDVDEAMRGLKVELRVVLGWIDSIDNYGYADDKKSQMRAKFEARKNRLILEIDDLNRKYESLVSREKRIKERISELNSKILALWQSKRYCETHPPCVDVPESADTDTYSIFTRSVTPASIFFGGGGDPMKVNCTGGGCPSEPITGTCSGDSCPDSFTLNCGVGSCPEEIQLDCAITECPKTANADCDAVACNAAVIQFVYDPEGQNVDINCTGSACPSEPITGTCFGDNCPDSFTLNCGGGGCTENIQLDCTGTTCPSEADYNCDAGACSESVDLFCTDNQCNAVTDPASTLQQLTQAKQQARQNALSANNSANTVADAFQQAGSTSVQTASSLAAAQNAAAVQEFLIDFASALADLASVSDFFEGLAKGDMSDNTILQNLDSIYEAAKDGESLANNIADQIVPAPEGGTSPINDAFGTMGVADDYWGTNGLTNINSLKSDFSDIINLIDDYRGGKPLNPRTIGQLTFRILKGFAENDLKEREQHIDGLQNNLAAEQSVMGGLAGELQGANQTKWDAMDALTAACVALRDFIGAYPESLSGLITGDSPVESTPVRWPSCQDKANLIDTARTAMYVADQQIAATRTRQQELESTKRALKQKQDELASTNRSLNTYRDGLHATDVPVLGEDQTIQNKINLMEMDRRQLVNEIGRLEREIEILGDHPEETIASLEGARDTLRGSLRDLRYDLYVCEEECDAAHASDDASEIGKFFVELLDVKNISGNNLYDRQDPISQQTGSGGGSGSTIQVLVFGGTWIPISNMTLVGTEPGCPPSGPLTGNHYHGSPGFFANACDGLAKPDPASGGCGFGRAESVISIPISQCANP